jgi:RND superfamily putative drug exporter
MKFPSQFTKLVRVEASTSQEPDEKPKHKSYGQAIYRLRWLILALWIAATLCCVPFAGRVADVMTSGTYVKSGSEASQVEQALVTRFHQPASRLFVVLESTNESVNAPDYQRQLQAVQAWARRLPGVSTVTSRMGNDTRSAVINIGFHQTDNALVSYIPAWRDQLLHLPAGPAQMSLAGSSALTNDWQYFSEESNRQGELIALPLLLCVLFIVFRNVFASLIPLLLAGTAMIGAQAIVYAVALHTEVCVFALNVLSLVCLGLSIDYSLLFIHRFREELTNGSRPEHALEITLATTGIAIFHSGLIILLGFTALLFIDLPLLRSFGLGGICATALALLASLTLLPALLSILGTRIRIFSFAKAAPRASWLSLAWQRWLQMTLTRPLPILLLVLAILVSLGLPALSLKLGIVGTSTLPTSSQARRGLEVLQAHFPTFADDSLLVIAQTPDRSNVLTSTRLQQLQAITDWIAETPHVTRVTGLTSPPEEVMRMLPPISHLTSLDSFLRLPAVKELARQTTSGDSTLLAINTDEPIGSDGEQALIQRLRTMPPTIRDSWHILVGGTRAESADFTAILYAQSLPPFLFLLATTFFALMIMFRSPVLALKAVLMNLLSLTVAFGILVFVFQQGHFANLLGFTTLGSIDRFVPLLLFCLLFGISMDYEVFLLSRIREEWLRTGDNTAAVAYGLGKTRGVITSAALLLMIVSAAFVCTSLVITKEIGLGVTASVFIDATLIRCMLVPVTMRLLGRWNWWYPSTHLIHR